MVWTILPNGLDKYMIVLPKQMCLLTEKSILQVGILIHHFLLHPIRILKNQRIHTLFVVD